MWGDSSQQVFQHNEEIARVYNRPDLVQIWKIASCALIIENAGTPISTAWKKSQILSNHL